jgi:hypothetical protein
MVTAITHHRFSSALWGEGEVRKLEDELAEIEMSAPEDGCESRRYAAHRM